ncbi:hypothetical protein LSAT2_016211, partial [Lamellibrachia satsuma]
GGSLVFLGTSLQRPKTKLIVDINHCDSIVERPASTLPNKQKDPRPT